MEISNQKSGDNSTNLQAGGAITVNNNSVALYSIEEVSKQLLASVFGELPDETKLLITQNQKSYFQALTENLQKVVKGAEDVKKIVDSPDFQYISKTASISASRSSSPDLHKNLSSLIIQRVNFNNEDLKRIVFNEAITTIEKLTTDQLKILTLCFLIKRTKNNGLLDLDQFKQYVNQKIKPFVDFKRTTAEFEHLAYTGCASISIASNDVVSIFKSNYSSVFPDDTRPEEILADNETATALFSAWKDTQIQNMNLTSVGIVIASTYYEQVTGDRINIDIWIN
jgi:hypothetical protein